MSSFAQNSFVRKEDKENSKAASPRRARERSAPPKERSRSMAEKVEKIETTEKTKKSVRLWNLVELRDQIHGFVCSLAMYVAEATHFHGPLRVAHRQNAPSLVQPICPPLAVLCVDNQC